MTKTLLTALTALVFLSHFAAAEVDRRPARPHAERQVRERDACRPDQRRRLLRERLERVGERRDERVERRAQHRERAWEHRLRARERRLERRLERVGHRLDRAGERPNAPRGR